MDKQTMNTMTKHLWKVALGLILIGLIGMAIYGFDFNDAEGRENMDKKWTFSEHDLSHLEVISGSSNVEVTFTSIASEAQPYIHVVGPAEEDVVKRIEATQLSNQTLSLDFTVKGNWRFFSFDFTSHTIDVTVALPNDVVLDTFQFDASSGNGYLNHVKGHNVHVETTSGNIRFNHIEAEHIVVKCTSGNVNGKGLIGSSDVHCRSGNINIDQIAGDVTASITSGNITLQQSVAANANVEATSGNVRFHAAPDFAGYYDLRATSGSINAPESPRITDHTIMIRTKSGNIRVK